MHSLRIISISIALALGLSACAWVKPSTQGAQVKVAEPSEVGHCRKVGTTTVSVMDKVVGVPRSYRTMAEELANLARNEAPNLQGDTVVPVGDIINGQQQFEVYDCRVEEGGAMTMPYSQ
ncbi:MAG: DUF4156 domain-containing protein [Gammaproteobacteria bacterium]|nr:DUF4156 domain-containing protein [Gammaproteobacteria bacterium]